VVGWVRCAGWHGSTSSPVVGPAPAFPMHPHPSFNSPPPFQPSRSLSSFLPSPVGTWQVLEQDGHSLARQALQEAGVKGRGQGGKSVDTSVHDGSGACPGLPEHARAAHHTLAPQCDTAMAPPPYPTDQPAHLCVVCGEDGDVALQRVHHGINAAEGGERLQDGRGWACSSKVQGHQ